MNSQWPNVQQYNQPRAFHCQPEAGLIGSGVNGKLISKVHRRYDLRVTSPRSNASSSQVDCSSGFMSNLFCNQTSILKLSIHMTAIWIALDLSVDPE